MLAAVRVVAARGPDVDADARPAQDVLGPVLLVPGYGGAQAALEPLADRIRATGRTATVVALPANGTGDLSAQVDALNRAVDGALAAGAPSVDVVGLLGGRGGGRPVGRARRRGGQGAPGRHAGLAAARHDGGGQRRRVRARRLPRGLPPARARAAPRCASWTTAGVGRRLPWLSIWTTADQTVTPPDSARLDGAVDVALQDVCGRGPVSHGQLPGDPAVVALVLRGLSTAPLTGRGCPVSS